MSAALGGGKQFTLYAVPLSQKLKDLIRHTTYDIPEPLHQHVDEEERQPFTGMWPEGANIPMKGEMLEY